MRLAITKPKHNKVMKIEMPANLSIKSSSLKDMASIGSKDNNTRIGSDSLSHQQVSLPFKEIFGVEEKEVSFPKNYSSSMLKKRPRVNNIQGNTPDDDIIVTQSESNKRLKAEYHIQEKSDSLESVDSLI